MAQIDKQIAILLEKFDRRHLSYITQRKKNIDAIYDELCREAARIGVASGFNDATAEFHLKDFPSTQKRIDNIIGDLASSLTISIQEGSKQEWLLAEEKNKRMINLIAKKTGIEREKVNEWVKPHTEALKAFQERKNEQGKQLSDRVWDMSQQAKSQIELALDIGLGEGKSAAELSRDVREYLREPHKLFRRVRDKHGVLRLSKNAQAYHPGMGVYRSSYKNALRMTATENNMAYRTADHETWSQLDFVIGQKVQLSNNHTLNGKPFKDMCDELCGDYPKGFKYTGWHPFCRCFVTPILADWNEQLKVMKMRREGKDVSNYHFKGEITDVPQGYKNWVSNNANRIAKAKSVPYFIRDNYVGGDINGGFKWNERTQETTANTNKTLEAARLRHEARTPEEIERIKTRAANRQALIESNEYDLYLDTFKEMEEWGVNNANVVDMFDKPLQLDEYGNKEISHELFKFYDKVTDRQNDWYSVRGKITDFKYDGIKINDVGKLRYKQLKKKIDEYYDNLDKSTFSKAKVNRFIKDIKQEALDIKKHREEVLKQYRERQTKNLASQREVSKKMPKELAAKSKYLEDEDYWFAKEFFDMLKETPTFEFVVGEGGGYESKNGHLVHIEGKSRLHRSRVHRITLIYHEVGHAIADQRGLINDPRLVAIREAQIKLLRKKPKTYKWERELTYKDGKWVHVYKKVKVKSQADYLNARINALYEKIRGMDEDVLKRHGINKHDVIEYLCSTADTLKSLITSYGWGHSDSYFRSERLRQHEYIAHAFENTFSGNPVFKKLMPDIYEETIAYIRQVQAESRDLNPNWK